LMVRPSYVLGGRGMEVVYDEKMLTSYVNAAVDMSEDRPILIDRFLDNAIETEVDAISDGEDVVIPSIMEHIELAGIHSGDSACSIPPKSIPEQHIKTMEEYTKKIALELNVIGLINIQYAIANDKVYILEANPRASRTVPLVSKVTNVSMASIATQVIIGKNLKDMNLTKKKYTHVGIKEAVFPFNMFPEVDPILGPEMRSTGEVLGMADTFGVAYFKAQEAAGMRLPTEGTALITVAPKDQELIVDAAKILSEAGFKILATEGTHEFLMKKGIKTEIIKKVHEGRPNIVDAIKNKEIQLVINTPIGKASKYDDSYIRKSAIKYRIPYITTPAAAKAAAEGIKEYLNDQGTIKSLQEYHSLIK
ncbi:MAG: ATP-grasp domain-containing protein, partial [Nanoarchaeota archaeon]|nr:ATP-grasp domain-containing protein [Nanoarchaeota archaeon]